MQSCDRLFSGLAFVLPRVLYVWVNESNSKWNEWAVSLGKEPSKLILLANPMECIAFPENQK